MKPKVKEKTGGRQRGTPNKTTLETRLWIKKILDANQETLEADLRQLEPLQRWQVLGKLFDFVCPKQSAIKADVSFESMTEEQLDTIITNLKNQIDDED